MKTSIVYLLHFNRPYKHAKHYLGSTSDLSKRIKQHRNGKSGSHLIRVIYEAGIEFVVARTWDGDRTKERRMKGRGLSKLCPICNNRVLIGTQNNDRLDHLPVVSPEAKLNSKRKETDEDIQSASRSNGVPTNAG